MHKLFVNWIHKNPDSAIKLIYLTFYLLMAFLAGLLFFVSVSKAEVANEAWCTVFNTGRRDCSFKDYDSAWKACFPDTPAGQEYCEGIEVNCDSPSNKDVCKQ